LFIAGIFLLLPMLILIFLTWLLPPWQDKETDPAAPQPTANR
jgi:hypothetical protein